MPKENYLKKPITLEGIGKATGAATVALVAREGLETMVTNPVVRFGEQINQVVQYGEMMFRGDLPMHQVNSPSDLAQVGATKLGIWEANTEAGSSISDACNKLTEEVWNKYYSNFARGGLHIDAVNDHKPFHDLPQDLQTAAQQLNEVCHPDTLRQKMQIIDNLVSEKLSHETFPESGLSAFVKNIEAMIDHPETIPEKLWEVAGLLVCVVGVDTLISLGSMFAGSRNIWTNKWENLNTKQKMARGAMDALVVAITAAVIVN